MGADRTLLSAKKAALIPVDVSRVDRDPHFEELVCNQCVWAVVKSVFHEALKLGWVDDCSGVCEASSVVVGCENVPNLSWKSMLRGYGEAVPGIPSFGMLSGSRK